MSWTGYMMTASLTHWSNGRTCLWMKPWLLDSSHQVVIVWEINVCHVMLGKGVCVREGAELVY
jgi:hypothetical protein